MQLSYNQYGDASIAGALHGIGPVVIDSLLAEEDIPVGYPVMLGTDTEKQVKKATTGASVVGIAVHDYAREQDSKGNVVYKETEAVSVLKFGKIAVRTSKAVAAGAKANVTVADGTFTDAAAATGIEAVTNLTITFLTATEAAGDIAIVEVK